MAITLRELQPLLALPDTLARAGLAAIIEREMNRAPKPSAAAGPTGAKHDKCVGHVPTPEGITFLTTRWLCVGKGEKPATLTRFVADLQRTVDKRHAAHAKRPTGDGMLAWLDGKRIRPRKLVPARNAAIAATKLPAAWNTAICPEKPARKPVPAIPLSTLGKHKHRPSCNVIRRRAKRAA